MSYEECRHGVIVRIAGVETGERCRLCEMLSTGPHTRNWPPLKLCCTNCGLVLVPTAHDTGDGWDLHLGGCHCEKPAELVQFGWPEGVESLTADDLRAMGFIIV